GHPGRPVPQHAGPGTGRLPDRQLTAAAMASQDPPENVWLDEDAGPVVRPYAMTRGRTRPASGRFDLISLITATPTAASAVGMGFGPEHVAITRLCRYPLSVAEIAGR